MTACAPAASAVRMIVPAFPGSRTSAQMTIGPIASVMSSERLVEVAAHRHHAGGRHGVRERREGAVVYQGDDGVGEQAGVLLDGRDRREDLDDTVGDLERPFDGLRAVGKEQPPLGANRTAAELARLLDPAAAGGQGDVRSGQAEASALGALTSSGRAAFAVSTSTLNAAMSLTASSARIFRSTSTPARLRPWMKRL